MHYTSGTTGKPKGVKRGLVDIDPDDLGALLRRVPQACSACSPHDGNVHITGSPLYHTAVLMWTGNSLHLGHTVVLMDKWTPEEMLRLIDEHRVTTSHMVPTQFHRLLALPEDVRAKYDVSSLRCMVHAAAPCPPEVKRRMIEWWGDAIMEYYAATEGGGTHRHRRRSGSSSPGTVGKAWPGAEIRISTTTGNELGRRRRRHRLHGARPGRLRVQGRRGEDQRQPHATGFFTVGDFGVLDEDGYLFLKDRKSDMIISGGVNIYPAEIEGELLTHPKVGDVAVFGIPHDDWGEEIKAVVEPAEGVEPGDRARDEIFALLPASAWPSSSARRRIDFIAEMPRDPNGKLYKRKLRDPYWEGRSTATDLSVSRTGRGGGGRRPRARRRPARCRTSR